MKESLQELDATLNGTLSLAVWTQDSELGLLVQAWVSAKNTEVFRMAAGAVELSAAIAPWHEDVPRSSK